MRYDYLKIFTKLGGGAKIKDEQIVAWANDVTKGPKGIEITSFKDPSIASGRPLLDIIDVLKPDTIDWTLVKDDPGEYKRNAMYVLSIVRSLGATVYALPEDIVDVNPQMVMTVYASLMAYQQK
jgi:plastin-2